MPHPGLRISAAERHRAMQLAGLLDVRRVYNPALHPRILRGPGGGQFLSKKLVAGQHPHKEPQSTDLLHDPAKIEALRQTVRRARSRYAGRTADDRLAAISALQGFDGAPTVVPSAEMDRLLATGDFIEVWRGVKGFGAAPSQKTGGSPVSTTKTAAAINDEFRTGPAYFGTGIYGNGFYFSTARETAQGYADDTEGSLVRALIPKDARIGRWRALREEARRINDHPGEDGTLYDEGRYAAARGIDVMEIDDDYLATQFGVRPDTQGGTKSAFNVLNRSVLVVEDSPSADVLAEKKRRQFLMEVSTFPLTSMDFSGKVRHRALQLAGIVGADEDVEALLVALDEFRAWDPAKHPRNLKDTPGGGRFRSLVAWIKAALKIWDDKLQSSGDTVGDSPLAGFSHEQLQRAVKKLGLSVRPDASRAEIEELFNADLRARMTHDALIAGRAAHAPPPPIDVLMRRLAQESSANLAGLEVRGYGNEHLYAKHLREIPRDQMPQLPENVAGLTPFLKALNERGVKSELVDMDPRQLTMTQNQLDSKKVGYLYDAIRDKGWREETVMVASREGAILDGHHRWAAASAVRAAGVEFDLHVLKVDMGIDELLTFADGFSGVKKSMEQAMVRDRTLWLAGIVEERKYNPSQARVPKGSRYGGRWGSVSVMHKLWDRAKEGGFTYNTVSGDQPTTGFALSVYPDRSRVIATRDFTPASIQEYRDANREVLSKPNHYLGAWRERDEDEGVDRVWLDVSIVQSDRAEAERVGQEFDQIAMFDLGEGTEISLGGKGGEVGLLADVAPEKPGPRKRAKSRAPPALPASTTAQSDSDYQPGKWKKADNNVVKEEFLGMLRDYLHRAGLSTEDVKRMVEDERDDLPDPRAVYENGPHYLTVWSDRPIGQLRMGELFDAIDRLQTTNPSSDPLRISIRPQHEMPGPPGVAVGKAAGATIRGTGSIILSDRMIDDWNDPDLFGNFMPVRTSVPLGEYVVTHEWGHVVDHSDEDPLAESWQNIVWQRNAKYLSIYGNTEYSEGYAEAFAEWFLTKGQTTNVAAQAYAKEYGWKHG